MRIKFIKGKDNAGYSRYFKQYITGGFYWLKLPGRFIFTIVVIRQKTLFYTYRILLHEVLHYLNFIITKNEYNKFNDIIERYI